MKKILLTGAAGFIGFHTTRKLLSLGLEVTGLDNLVPYYEPALKKARLQQLGITPARLKVNEWTESIVYPGLRFIRMDTADREGMTTLFREGDYDAVIHLAAQPGVRESLRNPYQYIDSNINGLITMLEGCRHHAVKHLVIASSSSVYGNNEKVPFSETDRVDEPISLYAATKKSGELMGYTYAHLFNIPITALRFFTVYGPWGRPDMAYYKFVRAIHAGSPIEVYNQGELYRDFTYVDDIVEGISNLLQAPPSGTPPFDVLNIGNSNPVKLMDFIETIENLVGKKAVIKYLPMQPGDVFTTFADVDRLDARIGFKPQTTIQEGLKKFIDWYAEYHKIVKP